MDDPTARVTRADDGTLVLVDPDAAAVAEAVARHNCEAFLALNADRVEHFLRRAATLRAEGRRDLCLVILDVDDSLGSELADVLMPGYDWQAIRDRGEKPVARGLVTLSGMVDVFEQVAAQHATALKACPRDHLPVVVMTGGGVLVTSRAVGAPDEDHVRRAVAAAQDPTDVAPDVPERVGIDRSADYDQTGTGD